VVQACNPRTKESKAESLWVQGKPRLYRHSHNETQSQKNDSKWHDYDDNDGDDDDVNDDEKQINWQQISSNCQFKFSCCGTGYSGILCFWASAPVSSDSAYTTIFLFSLGEQFVLWPQFSDSLKIIYFQFISYLLHIKSLKA
jgi:hypothetical protein